MGVEQLSVTGILALLEQDLMVLTAGLLLCLLLQWRQSVDTSLEHKLIGNCLILLCKILAIGQLIDLYEFSKIISSPVELFGFLASLGLMVLGDIEIIILVGMLIMMLS